MSVDVGDMLDKYELKERVGQGGMAVVYRGLDTSLRREVAVKVLHRHLADSKEARDRFEREAQAVAKLRHENILEIFDFSGTDSEQSYIVTEFIDGRTLKEFVAEHPISAPEIGAMIASQVCLALDHAHRFGVLHRDVKPENIMIRRDGVVKLTDFGISQMLDAQRMTVTGQLLGSPAYMSPEHVEGEQLDFRTDVFAVGIVVYQMVTGELPFKGKNPHEILKRIAECRYIDPQVVNPRVGRELSRIVKKSLARSKDDRYSDVSELLSALEAYLAGCGLEDWKTELREFFADPPGYQERLQPRLIDTLSAAGRAALATNQVRALELFNRVLTMDPGHKEVLGILGKLGRRRRLMSTALLFGGVALLGVIGYGMKQISDNPRAAGVVADAGVPTEDAAADAQDALTAASTDGAPAAPDASAVEVAVIIDAGQRRPRADARPRIVRRTADARTARSPDASTGRSTRRVALSVNPGPGSEYRVGSGSWRPYAGPATVVVPTGSVTVAARNKRCCAEAARTLPAGTEGDQLNLTLPFLPASVTPVCDAPGVSVRIDGRLARLGRSQPVVINNSFGTVRVKVEFFGDEMYDLHTREVRYNQATEVKCRR